MACILKIRRGPEANLPNIVLEEGELAFTTDTHKLVMGCRDAAKVIINADVVEPGAYSKPVVDAQGRVIGNEALTAEEIPVIPSNKVSGLGTAAFKDIGMGSEQIPITDASGLLPRMVIPPLNSVPVSLLQGIISLENLPKGALEYLAVVADDEERFALTTEQVQKGDSVKVMSTNQMYIVVDEALLDQEEGYVSYSSGYATSVPWSGVTGKPTTLAELGIDDIEPKITKNTAFNKNFGTSTAVIKMNGPVSVGSSNDVARIDHVHPVDTSRAPVVHTHAQADIEGLVATLSAKAPLASPSFSGTPRATTPTATDNSTRIATTAYVKAQGFVTSIDSLDCGEF